MVITQTTQFPSTPTMPGGSAISVTGANGTELKSKLATELANRLAAQQAGSQALTDALAAVNA